MKKYTKQAFTLVELIVVITILAILGTIAFISLQGYSKQARDSRRVSDISNIKTSLELFSLNTGKYPIPDNWGMVSYSGETLFTQGIVGDNVTQNLSANLQEKPTDPLHEIEYIYSTTNSRKEYELLAFYEGESANITQNSYAANQYKIKTTGNYNGVYVNTPNFLIPLPSIITSETLGYDLKDDTTKIGSMIINGGNNYPDVGIPGIEKTIGGLQMTFVYTGVINDNSTDAEKISVINTIQSAYSGSYLANIGIYADILSKTTDEEKLALVADIVLKNGSTGTSVSTSGGDDTQSSSNGNDEYTKLLIHGNDNFIDSSMSNHNITNNGNIAFTNGVSVDLAKDTYPHFCSSFDTSPADGISDNEIGSGTGPGSDYNSWHSGPGQNQWISIQLPEAKRVTTMRIRSGASWYSGVGALNSFQILGSNDTTNGLDGSWTTILNIDSNPDANGTWQDFTITNPGEYKNYKLESFSLHDYNWLIIEEWDLFEDNPFGKALNFDGAGDYIEFADSVDFDFLNGDFTIDYWFKYDPTRTNHSMFTIGSTDFNAFMIMQIGNKLSIQYDTNGVGPSWEQLNQSTSNLVGNTWYHVAVSKTGNNYYLFLNGNIEKTWEDSSPISLNNNNLKIGSHYSLNSSYFFKGDIDELRISKSIARTQDSNDYMYDPEGDGFNVPTQPYGN